MEPADDSPPPVDKAGRRSFWPTEPEEREKFWALVSVAFLVLAVTAPLFAFAMLSRFLPAGDSWPLVMMRVSLLVAGLMAMRAWWFACIRFARWAFEERLPSTIGIWDEPRTEPPRGINQTMQANWHLLAWAGL
ncbi:MAG TPA: hypothetical protein VH744_09620, partial [Terriglobales bacterium]